MNLNYQLSRYLMEKGLLDENEMEEYLGVCREFGDNIADYIIKNGKKSKEDTYKIMGEFFHMPYVEFDLLKPDDNAKNRYSVSFLTKNNIVPITIDASGTMVAAIGHPYDISAMNALKIKHFGRIEFIFADPEKIQKYLISHAAIVNATKAIEGIIDETKKDEDLAKLEEVTNNYVENSPAVQLVESIINEAIPMRASDIHIEPFEKQVRVRYRIDGDLVERTEFPITSFPAICARLKIIANLDIAERRVPQDGRINRIINGKEYDFRVSTIPTAFGEKFVVRILDKSSFSFKREDLGFTDNENKIIDEILSEEHGVILLTGPTGCGKSTTLYSFLKELNKPDVNIITVEDPIEYMLYGINQVQVNTKADMTFARALRSILRQDPNIIMVGEIRDEETAQIAIRAAITGHLVFSTLHTNDAPGAINRLIDMGVKGYLVEDSLVAVIAQRLVKRLCPMCKLKSLTSETEMNMLGLSEPTYTYKPQGCQYCDNTGYKGRIAVHEVMKMNDRLRSLVSKNKTTDELKEVAREEGMLTLWDTCKLFVLDGTTSIEELYSLY